MEEKMNDGDEGSVLKWAITVPILTDPYVTGTLMKVFGISIGFSLVIIYFVSRPHMSLLDLSIIGVGLVVLMAVLILFSVGVVMRNRMHYEFRLTEKGISQYMGEPERDRNRILLGLGLLTGDPKATGSALLASSKEIIGLPWNEVKEVRSNDRRYFLQLRDSWHTIMLVYCTSKNYDEVKKYINQHIN